MRVLTQHPLSAAFPAMSPVDLSALTDDIATHGLRQPVVTFEGQVLDGWHRYQACLHAEVAPTFTEYGGEDPVALVLSLNMSRRHLTSSQRAAAVVACTAWKPQGKPVVGAKPAPGAELLAKSAEVSTRTIEHAKAAQKAGLGDAVRDGKVSAKRGAEIAKLPPQERAAAIEAKPERREPRQDAVLAEISDDAARMADLVGDFEAAVRIIEADDKVAEAWAEVKALSSKLDEMNRLYEAKCAELATMTKEAKRWKRQAEAKGAA